jgi:predicted transcriptional regulator
VIFHLFKLAALMHTGEKSPGRKVMQRHSRRESEVLEALYRLGEGSVGDVQAELGGPQSYDAVRTTLRILEEKGAVKHRAERRRFIYRPAIADSKAWKSTARRLADTFFGGSLESAALAMLRISDVNLSEAELEKLHRRIEQSKRGSDDHE